MAQFAVRASIPTRSREVPGIVNDGRCALQAYCTNSSVLYAEPGSGFHRYFRHRDNRAMKSAMWLADWDSVLAIPAITKQGAELLAGLFES